jgi:hypothetical protein
VPCKPAVCWVDDLRRGKPPEGTLDGGESNEGAQGADLLLICPRAHALILESKYSPLQAIVCVANRIVIGMDNAGLAAASEEIDGAGSQLPVRGARAKPRPFAT